MREATLNLPSFAAVALRVGVVGIDELREAYAQSRQAGERLDAVLERRCNLDPDLVLSVHAARRRLADTCRACGGRPSSTWDRGEFSCRCAKPRLAG